MACGGGTPGSEGEPETESESTAGTPSGNGPSGGSMGDGTADTTGGSDDATSASESSGGPPASCALEPASLRITEIDVGETIDNGEDERALEPLVIAPIPSGGSRLAWKSGAEVHVVELDADDQIAGPIVGLPANSFADLHADDEGGVVLVSRDAAGNGAQHCGTLSNLCGPAGGLPSQWACWDMMLVRFDDAGEVWTAQLTDSSAEHPPYLNGPEDPDNVVFIWEAYAHHGRIAFDGTRWAAYFGAAISVSQACVDPMSALDTAVNIHQGDRMQLVGPDGTLEGGGFGWGCSHSGYERVIWDPAAEQFVAVCKTDNDNRIALPAPYRTVYPVDLWYSNLSGPVTAAGGGYWIATSDIRPGQPAMAAGLADVHLLHFGDGEADEDLVVASDAGLNDRAPHLAAYGADHLMVAWESSPSPGDLARNDPERTLHLQALHRDTGAPEGDPLPVDVLGNRYQQLRGYPDGSVAFPAPGDTPSSVRILRVLPCG